MCAQSQKVAIPTGTCGHMHSFTLVSYQYLGIDNKQNYSIVKIKQNYSIVILKEWFYVTNLKAHNSQLPAELVDTTPEWLYENVWKPTWRTDNVSKEYCLNVFGSTNSISVSRWSSISVTPFPNTKTVGSSWWCIVTNSITMSRRCVSHFWIILKTDKQFCLLPRTTGQQVKCEILAAAFCWRMKNKKNDFPTV